ncbi:TetR/AcrR family transcriptional regulator [Pseudonocardia parietis]|uniref:AcrR family transcriptional regulator n=1 Tax=Pseudonocardia parietis TaxID=570936 RepID=A0ABS4W4I6_9PSEU|nr:TetR/AcrR family transcriptional regulator [Pseudonocardia parietis]MBP2371120.1 AcrR family transcriptional regulator [Pseudonocardia parietis]
MNASRTARERARTELVAEITAAARRQLAETGAAALSMRAVSREIGMVSSALHRYFPTRDDLLTALIVQSYDALADAVTAAADGAAGPASSAAEPTGGAAGPAGNAAEPAGSAAGPAGGAAEPADPGQRWRAIARAVRTWALANPHEYALIYGSPVPGYRAPTHTVPAAARVLAPLARLLADAHAAGTLQTDADADAGTDTSIAPVLAEDAARLRDALGTPDLPDAALLAAVTAWTGLFGHVSFELFGQFENVLEHRDAVFEGTVDRLGRLAGLVR